MEEFALKCHITHSEYIWKVAGKHFVHVSRKDISGNYAWQKHTKHYVYFFKGEQQTTTKYRVSE